MQIDSGIVENIGNKGFAMRMERSGHLPVEKVQI